MASRRLFDGAQIELDILPIVGAAAGAYTLVADGGTYSYSGNNADLIYTPAGAYILTADGGTYSYSGNNADLRFNRRLVADGETYSYSGNNANLVYAPAGAFVLLADGGVFSYSGNNANLVFSGQSVAQPGGAYGKQRRAKQREFKDERREREELRLLIEQAVDPIKARSARVIETEAEDGTTGVAIVTRGRQTAVPVPAAFDASEVVAMVAAALERAGVEARRVATEQARRKAVAALESAIQERQRLILKRRREEEILLLM